MAEIAERVEDNPKTAFEKSDWPLGTIGLASFALGALGMVFLSVTWIINSYNPGAFPPLHERPLLIYSVAALLLGAQMMSIGFLAELITAYQGQDEHSYSIAEQIGSFENKPESMA